MGKYARQFTQLLTNFDWLRKKIDRKDSFELFWNSLRSEIVEIQATLNQEKKKRTFFSKISWNKKKK